MSFDVPKLTGLPSLDQSDELAGAHPTEGPDPATAKWRHAALAHQMTTGNAIAGGSECQQMLALTISRSHSARLPDTTSPPSTIGVSRKRPSRRSPCSIGLCLLLAWHLDPVAEWVLVIDCLDPGFEATHAGECRVSLAIAVDVEGVPIGGDGIVGVDVLDQKSAFSLAEG